jgi:two-component system sensor histidine kinase/response regulator
VPMLHLNWQFLPVFDSVDAASDYVGVYDPWLVVASVVMAILAAYVALSISDRIVAAQTGRTRWAWTSTGAIVLGGGIWAMHFVGMLAFSLPCGVGYNLVGTILSIIPGILASGVALSVIGRKEQPGPLRLSVGAVLMGAGIGAMHYSGMAAMEPEALLRYDPAWAAASVFTAIGLALISLSIRYRLRGPHFSSIPATLIAAAVMGFAVAGMHYTAMHASLFFPLSNTPKSLMPLSPLPLAAIITIFIVLIASIALVASFAGRQAELALRLKAEIAERERSEAELLQARQADARLLNAIAGLGAGIALFDETDRLVVANPTYRRIHEIIADILVPGVSFETILRENVRRSRFDLGAEEAETYIARRLEQHRNPGPVVERRLNEGRWEQVREQRLSDGGLLLVILDITKEKAREAALTEAKSVAEEANRAKSVFLSTMSHELRTPLNAIIGFTDLMLNGVFGPIGSRKYVEYAEDVHRSGHLLLDMINEILDLSKIEAGRYELYPEDVGVARLVGDCVSVLSVIAQQREVALTFAASDLLTVRADERAFKQVMLNLLSNAVKFTPAAGHVRVEAAAAADGTIAIVVSDTGVGIAADDLERVFEPFRRGEASLTRAHEGTGLGLAITKHLVELSHGRLALESQVGVGTTVTVWLPAAEASSFPGREDIASSRPQALVSRQSR